MPLSGILMSTGAGKPAGKLSALVVGLECGFVLVELLVAVIRAHRVVVRVGIVFKRRVADAEASANYSLFTGTIGQPEARRKVGIPGLQSKIGRIRTYPGDDQGISRRIIIGKASGALGGCRRIEFPAKPQIHGQLRRNLPFIAGEGEEPPLPICGEKGVDVPAHL